MFHDSWTFKHKGHGLLEFGCSKPYGLRICLSNSKYSKESIELVIESHTSTNGMEMHKIQVKKSGESGVISEGSVVSTFSNNCYAFWVHVDGDNLYVGSGSFYENCGMSVKLESLSEVQFIGFTSNITLNVKGKQSLE